MVPAVQKGNQQLERSIYETEKGADPCTEKIFKEQRAGTGGMVHCQGYSGTDGDCKQEGTGALPDAEDGRGRCKTQNAYPEKGTGVKKKFLLGFLAAGMLTVNFFLPASAMEEDEVRMLAEQIGGEYGICPELLQAVAWQESRYQETAQAAGCTGLMQISERWHQDRMEKLGVADLYDPAGNMKVAADYLSELAEKYEDIGMVLMIYNGDSRAEDYQKTGTGLSDYADAVLEMSQQLEREHGK